MRWPPAMQSESLQQCAHLLFDLIADIAILADDEPDRFGDLAHPIGFDIFNYSIHR